MSPTPTAVGIMSGSFQAIPDGSMSCVLTQAAASAADTGATKLCCTLGPSSRDVDTISKLLMAGMKIARFDFTWGSADIHQETLDNLRAAMAKTERTCAIAMETAGREVMVINKAPGPICLQAGDTVTLTCDKAAACSSALIPVSTLTTFEGHGIHPGSSIFVGPYLFTGSETTSAYLTVQQVNGVSCTCVCNNACSLEGMELTVHMAGAHIPGPAFPEADQQILATWGKRNEVDFVGVPFTTSAKDIEECKALLAKCGLSKTKVIAKIECLEGLKAHQEIIEAADVCIFARGKLGTRLDPAKVFLAQKFILRSCNIAGKPVFVTRVVDTMIDAPRPTRAEATDVANLVLDGADGILLGSETFRGKYPEVAVQTVSAICRQAEACFDSHAYYRANMDLYGRELFINMSKAEALASSAVRAAEKSHAKVMIVFTVTGNTARMIAKYKPKQPILAVICNTPSSAQYSDTKLSQSQAKLVHSSSMVSFRTNHRHGNHVMRQCLALRGVIPIMQDPELSDSAELLEYAIGVAKSMELVESGDKAVVSSCPRKNGNQIMEEMGVVSLVKVDEMKGVSSASQLNVDMKAVLAAA